MSDVRPSRRPSSAWPASARASARPGPSTTSPSSSAGRGPRPHRRERRRQEHADEDPERGHRARRRARWRSTAGPTPRPGPLDGLRCGVSMIYQELNPGPAPHGRGEHHARPRGPHRPAGSTARPWSGKVREVLESRPPSRDLAGRPGRPAERRGQAARRDRPGPVQQVPHPGHGRADELAHPGGQPAAVRDHPPAQGPGRQHHLHQPFPRGGPAGRRLVHGPARRPERRLRDRWRGRPSRTSSSSWSARSSPSSFPGSITPSAETVLAVNGPERDADDGARHA